MIQTYSSPIIIELTADTVTTFTRRLVDPTIFIDTKNKKIEVIWHMEHITPTGVVYFTSAHRQIADNDVLVNLTTQEHLTIEQYNAMDPQPDVMGEYDFWQLANKNSPFPVMDQVELYGTVFAQRNGWL